MPRLTSIGCVVCLLIQAAVCQGQQKLRLAKNDVVVSFGGTNMVHLQRAGYLEAILTHQFRATEPKFRDLSWEADSVYRQGSVIERWRRDGFGGLDNQLKRTGATVVVAQFGQLEALAGKKDLKKFVAAYERLIDAFQKRARQVVLISPTRFEKPKNSLIPDLSRRNDDLAIYVKAVKDIAARRKLLFIDLFTGIKSKLTTNGMHVTEAAQSVVAKHIAKQLGVAVPDATVLEALRLAVVEKHRLWFDYWRPANWKLLFGDDSRRIFTRGKVPFRQEWQMLLPLIARGEHRVRLIAKGGKDPGPHRPEPEKLHGEPSANIEQELRAFSAVEGLQVNLFASEKEGLTSPLAIRWDPAGRAYVTVTTTYPHIRPGDVPNDKIICLQDTNGDGKADKSTVFADGLNIPTGLELGDGGVYIGQNTELLFLQDTNGDGKADKRRVVLAGFGNGDSHQTINSFVWSPGGELFFGQGDGCESRVETPWGASNLYQAGFYRFRPKRLQLHPLLDDFMGPGNPWGVAFDEWGQIFSIDGAGGVTYLSPGQVPVSHRKRLRTIGRPGGYCGIERLGGTHLPKSLNGDFVVGDFKGNRLRRFSVKPNGAGYTLHWKQPLLQSRHRNFRPVDVRLGPDGAIYIVDWYNPITCHQDDAYRDPRRDKAHGRIWRISAKAPATKTINLTKAELSKVVDALRSPEPWTRNHAKRALTTRNREQVGKALGAWVRSLDPKSPQYEHHLYHALGAYATMEIVELRLLRRLLEARDHRARAYASRIVGRWHDRLDDPLQLLAARVADPHPQVRMEAVMACSAVPSARAVSVMAHVVDQPMDEWLQYAFEQSVHQSRPHWMPLFERGELAFAKPNHLAAVLNKIGGRRFVAPLKRLVDTNAVSPQMRLSAIEAIIAVGDAKDLESYGLDRRCFTQFGRYDAALHAKALEHLIEVSKARNIRAAGNPSNWLNPLIKQSNPSVQECALTLAGMWNVKGTEQAVLKAANDRKLKLLVRRAAFDAMAAMKLAQSEKLLTGFAQKPNPIPIRSAATASLVNVNVNVAATQAATLFREVEPSKLNAAGVLSAFSKRKGGVAALTRTLKATKLEPISAKHVLRSLYKIGQTDRELLDVLNQAVGFKSLTPDYNEALVKRLAREAEQLGRVKNGALLFRNMACISCHRVGGSGGDVGPDLTSIGTTLQTERIVEELLWPNRQVKEGYSLVLVATKRGTIHQGYERKTKASVASGDLIVHDLAANRQITIRKQDIEQKRVLGSVMPRGLTALLTRRQLLDLIRYLSERGAIR